MRIGLIARTDDSGLGTQTREAYRHLKPHKVLAIDYASFNGFKQHPDWYPNAQFVTSIPNPTEVNRFLNDIDIVFSCETPYSYHLLELARFKGIKTVIQPNYEFFPYLKNPKYPKPDLWAFPSEWHLDDIPYENKLYLPVPIATDRFVDYQEKPKLAKNFLHIVGKPAANDRNGTQLLIAALPDIKADVKITIKCQDKDYIKKLLKKASVSVPDNVELVIDTEYQPNYWENYKDQHVLVLPRRYGGLSLPVNEALGAGMPIIMPDIDPNNRWLPSEWLIPPVSKETFASVNQIEIHAVSPKDIAGKIDIMAWSEGAYITAAAKARKLAEQYSWATLSKMYLDVFQTVLDNKT